MPLLATRPSQPSPSVAIEKGAYRLRHAPKSRIAALRTPSKLRTSSMVSETASVSIRYERRMALLVVLLALASTVSFGIAYMLLITGKRGAFASPASRLPFQRARRGGITVLVSDLLTRQCLLLDNILPDFEPPRSRVSLAIVSLSTCRSLRFVLICIAFDAIP